MSTLFETILVRDGHVLLAEQHLARLTRSAAALGMPLPDEAAFRRVVDAAATHDAIRCTYDGATLAAEARPIPPPTLMRRERGRAITLDPSLVRTLPEHKLVEHYGVCERSLQQAFNAEADEALFLTRDGHVLEGTTTNVFAVHANTLITAPENVLPGITREWVLEQADLLGIDVELRAPSVTELRDGAFLTGSLTMLAPLRALDGEACRAPGAIFDALAERWSTLR